MNETKITYKIKVKLIQRIFMFILIWSTVIGSMVFSVYFDSPVWSAIIFLISLAMLANIFKDLDKKEKTFKDEKELFEYLKTNLGE